LVVNIAAVVNPPLLICQSWLLQDGNDGINVDNNIDADVDSKE
jgi:hypothetical protein